MPTMRERERDFPIEGQSTFEQELAEQLPKLVDAINQKHYAVLAKAFGESNVALYQASIENKEQLLLDDDTIIELTHADELLTRYMFDETMGPVFNYSLETVPSNGKVKCVRDSVNSGGETVRDVLVCESNGSKLQYQKLEFSSSTSASEKRHSNVRQMDDVSPTDKQIIQNVVSGLRGAPRVYEFLADLPRHDIIKTLESLEQEQFEELSGGALSFAYELAIFANEQFDRRRMASQAFQEAEPEQAAELIDEIADAQDEFATAVAMAGVVFARSSTYLNRSRT